MVKAAKKYGVKIDSPNPKNDLKEALPIWYHFGLGEGRSTANCPSAKRLRARHGVVTVADCLEISTRQERVAEHRSAQSCGCNECVTDRVSKGCENPQRCVVAAGRAVSKLCEKWRPGGQLQLNGLSLTSNRGRLNGSAMAQNEAVLFNPTAAQGAPTGRAFRVFLREEGECTAARRAVRPYQVPEEAVEVFTDGSCTANGEENAAAGAGVWFGRDDGRNKAVRVPGGVL